LARWSRCQSILEARRHPDHAVDHRALEAARQAGAGRGAAAALRDAGRAIRVNDAWIAATALAHEAALISSDRDFESIPRLETVIVNS
jgi:predicted nucleic acid-binding protein